MTETLTVVEYEACKNAADLVTFAHGAEQANPELARRARITARDLLTLADTLTAERSARRAIQDRAEQLQDIVGKATYHHCHPDDDIPF